MHLTPSAQLVINSADRQLYKNIGTTSGQYTSQPINNFTIAAVGQNIVQGAIDRIQVAEVNFPYDIPTIVKDVNDTFFLEVNGVGTQYTIDVPQGFYTGSELATAVNAALSVGVPAGERPNCVYDSINNYFTFEPNPTQTVTWNILTADFNLSANGDKAQSVPNTLCYTMGFTPQNPNSYGPTLLDQLKIIPGQDLKAQTPANLLYTQFIDICSRSLCGQVYIPDGSTTFNAFRKDLLCRLYIADESSSPVVLVPDVNGNLQTAIPGSRPFTIHRQFRNAKMIPNLNVNSINDVDISLYDDRGNLLLGSGFNVFFNDQIPLLTTGMRNFQITLNVFETAREVGK